MAHAKKKKKKGHHHPTESETASSDRGRGARDQGELAAVHDGVRHVLVVRHELVDVGEVQATVEAVACEAGGRAGAQGLEVLCGPVPATTVTGVRGPENRLLHVNAAAGCCARDKKHEPAGQRRGKGRGWAPLLFTPGQAPPHVRTHAPGWSAGARAKAPSKAAAGGGGARRARAAGPSAT